MDSCQRTSSRSYFIDIRSIIVVGIIRTIFALFWSSCNGSDCGFRGDTSSRTQQLVKNTGNYVESADYIAFDHVNIESPDEELMLVKDLSFEIKPGMNLLITGPNGTP